MKCPSCSAEVSAAKFCSNCGAALAGRETKQREEVTIDWLWEVYKGLGYEAMGDITRNEQGGSFLAKHKENPNVMVDFRSGLRFVLVTSIWTVKPPGMLERGEFFKAVNSMNTETIACQCAVDEKTMDTLCIQVPFFIADTVSRLDLIAFNEGAIALTRRVLNQERVRKIMA